MPSILDQAIRIAEDSRFTPGKPNPAEMKRATQLVQKMLQGTGTNSERLVLRNLLNKIGTSEQEVFAAIQEYSH